VTRVVRFGAVPAAAAFGLYAEWAALRRGPFELAASSSEVRLAVADFAVGVVFVGCGAVAWDHRPEILTGVLFVATGYTWFLGTFAGSGWPGYAAFGSLFVTLYRGPLTHALLGYPSGRPKGWIELWTIVGVYVLSAIAIAAETSGATFVTAGLVLAVAVYRYARSAGPERQARLVAATATACLSGVLVAGGVTSLAGAGDAVNNGVSWAYDLVLIGIAVGLLLDLMLRRWTQTTVTGLVVDLGELGEAAPLRARLAAALGDPTLEIGYRIASAERYVDERGHAIELPEADSERAVTIVRERDEPVAALIYDREAVLDPELVHSVAAAARLAVANASLQGEVRSQLEELEDSRRRIIEAGDAQRSRLEQQLREGAELRLSEVAALLGDAGQGTDSPAFTAILDETRAELERAQSELREFARGVHPRLLTEGGLAQALPDLARRAPVPVELSVGKPRFPAPVEAAAYFVCSEALANIGKYANASRAAIGVEQRNGTLVVAVSDDGRGGASLDAGSGLRGLADRVEALGGRLRVESPTGEGTRLVAELPLA
jgi:signal transduction histidine kinase